jgi:DNA modification methylase
MQFNDTSAFTPRWRMIHNDTIAELMGLDLNPKSDKEFHYDRSTKTMEGSEQRAASPIQGKLGEAEQGKAERLSEEIRQKTGTALLGMEEGAQGGEEDLRRQSQSGQPGREAGIQPPLVCSQPGEMRSENGRMGQEKSGETEGNDRPILQQTQRENSFQVEGVVSGKQTEGVGGCMGEKPEAILRTDARGVCGNAEKAGGQMLHLQGTANGKETARGPLPQDGESEGDSLQKLQLGPGPLQRRSSKSVSSNEVSAEAWPDNCVDAIITSIPFGDQYEYCTSLSDCGHNAGNGLFWEQMDFLIPELYRILKPGRVAAIHVKDRIRFGNVTGLGFPTVEPFSDDTTAAFRKHGFHLIGRITIDTDVVRENAQTYRLTWKEMVKDATKMGCGTCEYVILLRKPQTDTSKGYADAPVTKADERTTGDYTLAHWQIDAAGFWRSSGDRLPSAEVLNGMALDDVRRMWRDYSGNGVYNLREHEQLCQAMLDKGTLPTGWMLFAPVARHPFIWSDIERIRTLNSEQARRAEQQHVCPLQLDIIERLIRRYTNKGEIVFDPFAGIGSVPYQAIRMDRCGWGCELNRDYWRMAVGYCERAAANDAVPTLFDLAAYTADEDAA